MNPHRRQPGASLPPLLALALALLCLGPAACRCGGGLGDGGVGSGVLVVNELLAKNEGVNTDEHGEHDDWVEIYNPTGEEISLAGFALSDNAARPRKYEFPDDARVAAAGFLLVWTDGQPEQGPLHAGFRLSADGEEVLITDAEGALVDHVVFGPQQADVTVGRSPDGEGDLVALSEPTPGAANAAPRSLDAGPPGDAGPLPLAPVLNEVGPAGAVVVTDLGEDESEAAWVELYNPHDEAVSLEGLWLSPNPVVPRRSSLGAPLHSLAPGAFALVLLSGRVDGPADHASFSFAAPGTLVLSRPDGSLLERLEVPALPVGASFARLPDGEGGFDVAEPTPRAPNEGLADGGSGP